MRIAVSGTHRTGKTTLVDRLHRALPAYVPVDEPYSVLVEEGHEFAQMPGLEDFETQLDRSIDLIAESDENTVFDRCPADILAYLVTHLDARRFDVDTWLPRCLDAMDRLDLIVYVPVEEPDRIGHSEVEDLALRGRVDEELREMLFGRWGFEAEILEVTGAATERLRQVLTHIVGQQGYD